MTGDSRAPLPAGLERFAGRIADVDSHEAVPASFWVDQFGAVANDLAQAIMKTNRQSNTVMTGDDTEINAFNVWNIKGPRAPGSMDFNRRLDVMNFTQVHRQIMFPGGLGLIATFLYCNADDPTVLRDIQGDRKGYAKSLLRAHNDWCIRGGKINERVRPTGLLLEETVDDLVSGARHLIASGIRAIMLPTSAPPAGKSPAHPDLDPFWRFLADADIPVVLHVGAEGGFFKTAEWGNAPAFLGWKSGDEFALDPWTLSTFHLPAQNFTATMVIGGVFERHPNLRFGAIEVGANWIGPLAQNLDLWHAHARQFGNRAETPMILPMKPSDYIRRNVRVSAFDIEDVGRYIDHYRLDDVYCYASDYPHIEGGKNPMGDLAGKIDRLGPDIMEKFFVSNGAWLMPS